MNNLTSATPYSGGAFSGFKTHRANVGAFMADLVTDDGVGQVEERVPALLRHAGGRQEGGLLTARVIDATQQDSGLVKTTASAAAPVVTNNMFAYQITHTRITPYGAMRHRRGDTHKKYKAASAGE